VGSGQWAKAIGQEQNGSHPLYLVSPGPEFHFAKF
jgi:hypothetical protein